MKSPYQCNGPLSDCATHPRLPCWDRLAYDDPRFYLAVGCAARRRAAFRRRAQSAAPFPTHDLALAQPEFLFAGHPRRIILSEQGFHTPDGPDGEAIQAAAYCYAMRKVASLPAIDSFILHRHVDHGQEGGLRLGLWSRDLTSANPARPLRKKPIYAVFRATETPEEDAAYAFALPLIGWTNWEAFAPTKSPR